MSRGMTAQARTAPFGDAMARDMRSPVNWAVLGLVIKRPSYGYELAQRFEREYGEVLSLSSVSHIYAAIEALERRSLIAEVPATSVVQDNAGRQPKPCYRATAKGVHSYREQLIAQIREDHRRSQLFVRELAVFMHEPEAALQVLRSCEEVCLKEASTTLSCSPNDSSTDPGAALVDRLATEEYGLAVGARLSWLKYARDEFEALLAAEPSMAGSEPSIAAAKPSTAASAGLSALAS